MADMTALYREDATEDEYMAAMQAAVNSGDVWKMEGSMGRAAMDLIEGGYITLGETSHKDYWGNTVPSKYDVKPGTKGSQEYVDKFKAQRKGMS